MQNAESVVAYLQHMRIQAGTALQFMSHSSELGLRMLRICTQAPEVYLGRLVIGSEDYFSQGQRKCKSPLPCAQQQQKVLRLVQRKVPNCKLILRVRPLPRF